MTSSSSSFYDDVNRTCVVAREEFGRNPQGSDNNVHGESKFADVVVTPGRNAQLVTRCSNYDASQSGSRGDLCPCEGMMMSRMMMASSGSCPVQSSSWSSRSSHLLDEGDDDDDVESMPEADDAPPETVMQKTKAPTDTKDYYDMSSSAADVTPLESGVILTPPEVSSSDDQVAPSSLVEAGETPAEVTEKKAVTSGSDVVASSSSVTTSAVIMLTETKTIVTSDVTKVESSSVAALFTETVVERKDSTKKLAIPPAEIKGSAPIKEEATAPPSVCSSEASYLSETPDYDFEVPSASETTTTRIGNALKKLFVDQRHASNIDLIVDGLLGVVIVFQVRSFAARLYDLLSSS